MKAPLPFILQWLLDMKENLCSYGISLIGKHPKTSEFVSFHEQEALMKCITE
jgi:hypothetical protein